MPHAPQKLALLSRSILLRTVAATLLFAGAAGFGGAAQAEDSGNDSGGSAHAASDVSPMMEQQTETNAEPVAAAPSDAATEDETAPAAEPAPMAATTMLPVILPHADTPSPDGADMNGAPAYPTRSAGLSDAQLYLALDYRSHAECMHYDPAAVRLGLHALPPDAARKAMDMEIVFCTDSRLEEELPVAWYGPHRAMVWNPKYPKTTWIMAQRFTDMAAYDNFPPTQEAWNDHGDKLNSNRPLPIYEKRCMRMLDNDCH